VKTWHNETQHICIESSGAASLKGMFEIGRSISQSLISTSAFAFKPFATGFFFASCSQEPFQSNSDFFPHKKRNCHHPETVHCFNREKEIKIKQYEGIRIAPSGALRWSHLGIGRRLPSRNRNPVEPGGRRCRRWGADCETTRPTLLTKHMGAVYRRR